MLSKEEKLARLRLARSTSVGPSSFWKFIESYGSAVSAINVIKKHFANKIQICDDSTLKEEIDNMKYIGARFVYVEDALYPPLLRQIPDPPPVLSFLGDKDKVLSLYNKHFISVVGSRNSSITANKFCEVLCKELGIFNTVIVSGLARGIDATSHKHSLTTGTLAILACGIDIAYPQENTDLYRQIIKHGGLFAEMPFGTPPQPQLFPRRNSIIAGISSGTVVIEAALNSGSLITAKMALEYNRDVFAVPGSPLDPRSIGSNQLIKDGAILVQKADDILEHIRSRVVLQQPLSFRSTNQHSTQIPEKDQQVISEKILNSLSSVPITIDELISCIKVSPRDVLTILLELELANKIVRLHGQRVCLAMDS